MTIKRNRVNDGEDMDYNQQPVLGEKYLNDKMKKIRVRLEHDFGISIPSDWYETFMKQCHIIRKEEMNAMIKKRNQEMKDINKEQEQDLIKYIKRKKPQLLNKYSNKYMVKMLSGNILSGEYYGISECCTKEFTFNILNGNKKQTKIVINGVIPCERCNKKKNFESELCKRRQSRISFKAMYNYYNLFSEKEKSNYWLIHRPLFKENIDFCLRMKHLFWKYKQEGKPITIEDFKDSILDRVSGETYKRIIQILKVNYSIYNRGFKKRLF